MNALASDAERSTWEPGPEGYHCSGCNRYLSPEDGILAIVAPSSEPWATDYWRIERMVTSIPEDRIVFLGLLHEDCQREWFLTVDQHGDVYHGGPCSEVMVDEDAA